MNMLINLVNNITNVSLTCEADGASFYKWERQNYDIASDSVGVNTNTLTLINLQPEDAGSYQYVWLLMLLGVVNLIVLQFVILVSSTYILIN